jgi:hypothetical protein
MNYKRKDREAGCSLGDLVAALYDEVMELPVSDPAKESLVGIMLDDIMHREGCTIFFQASLLRGPGNATRRIYKNIKMACTKISCHSPQSWRLLSLIRKEKRARFSAIDKCIKHNQV